MTLAKLIAFLTLPNLRHKLARTGLTLVSLVTTFALFMLLKALMTSFAGGAATSAEGVFMVDAKYSMTDNVPLAHVHEIRQLPGVEAATPMTWFGSYYQNPQQKWTTYPIEPGPFFAIAQTVDVDAEARRRFESQRNGALLARTVAEQYGLQVGDVIPLQAESFPRDNGSWNWEFQLVGIVDGVAPPFGGEFMLVRQAYFEEAVAEWHQSLCGWVLAKAKSGEDLPALMRHIEDHFENSADPMRVSSLNEMAKQFTRQVGDIGLIATAILSAVFFTMILLTANTTSLTYRERVQQLAVLKTLGFSDANVVLFILFEIILLTCSGAALGIGMAFLIEPLLSRDIGALFGSYELAHTDTLIALLISLGVALLIAVVPVLRTVHTTIVEGLEPRT